ncbi:MAG TPA: 50S ribosomal protein L15e [Methanocorpusculum sp.]|nr:50S ribosomal protein L15e [Lachnospiraceae bacterium]HJJ46337.1 50S ribosomal protein L15e [Methanocorpusculum sp.]
MSKSMYGYVRDAWKKPAETGVKKLLWERMQTWRKQGAVVRVERPTRIDRAHALGYKAKQGIIVVRASVRRGGRRKSRYIRGRRTNRMSMRKATAGKNAQSIAEERAQTRYPNMEVLNSYWVGQDGKHKYFEVILVDRASPSVLADKNLAWVAETRGRVFRGKTSAGRKGRGQQHKGRGSEKCFPSIRSNKNHGK